MQRALANERILDGAPNPPALLTTREVVRMATIEGAEANGIADRTGTLAPGKQADMIRLRTDLPNVMPFNNAYGAIVTGMDTANVDSVIIGGRLMKRGGRLLGVDWMRVRTAAERSRDWLVAQAGWSRSVLDASRAGR